MPLLNSDNKKPVISVITAVYNGGEYLENAIRSVLMQTYSGIELIVIDGGSTDNTLEIIKKYERHLHYWISEKDEGVYDAWNKGVAAATGDWIVFLGSDDFFWKEDVISNSIPALTAAIQQNIRFAYGKVNLLSLSGSKIISVWGKPWEECKKAIFKFMTVTHCGAFHHTGLFIDHGNFNKHFRITGDYEFLLREFSTGGQAIFLDYILTGMRAGGVSADLKLKQTVARENIKALEMNGLPVSFHHKIQLFKAWLSVLFIKIFGINMVKKLSDVYRGIKGMDPMWTKID